MKRVFGGLMLLAGLALAGWIVHRNMAGGPEAQKSLGGLGLCLGLFIVGGMWVRGESKPRFSAETHEPVTASIVPPAPSRGININVSDLTVAGWGLLVATAGFLLAGVFLYPDYLLDRAAGGGGERRQTLVAVGMVVAAICFFQVGKRVLRLFGLRTYRNE